MHPFRRTRLEGASAARDPPRVFAVLGLMICLLGAADSMMQWEMAMRSFLVDKAVASHLQKVVVAPLLAVLHGLLLAAMVVQTHQKEASQEERRLEQPTRAQTPLWKMMKQAGKYTHYQSFCNLYTFRLGSDYNHCIGSRTNCVSTFLLAYGRTHFQP